MQSSDDLATAVRRPDDHSPDQSRSDEAVPARQVAALVWRQGDWGAEVLLVTSRISSHWLIPKGWPIEGMPAAGAAMQEAFEEAGAWGNSSDEPIGAYTYEKILADGAALPCKVDVFAVQALGLLDEWPERTQRRRRWFTLPSAAERVMEPDLANFLRQCESRLDTKQPGQEGSDVALTGYTAEPIVGAKEGDVISAAQCRAARGLVDWTISRLAEESGVLLADLSAFERGGDIDPLTVSSIMRSLEGAGAKFLPEGKGRGAGVRLKFARQTVKRIDIWENEGGPAAEDDVR